MEKLTVPNKPVIPRLDRGIQSLDSRFRGNDSKVVSGVLTRWTGVFLGYSMAIAIFSACTLYAEIADRIAAVVNNEPIMQSEVEDILGPIYMGMKEEYSGARLAQVLEKTRINVLNQLIEDQLIFQEAEKLGVKVEEHEIDAMLEEFKKQFASEEEMIEALKFRGLTLNRLRKSYKKQIAIRKLHAYEVRSKVLISPQEVQSYYESHKDDFSEKGHWLLSTITIRKHPDAVQKGTKSEGELDKINWILSELGKGVAFADLARKYSEDGYAKDGGEMGAVEMTSFTPEVEEAISKLDIGQHSGVIETERAYHIFRLDGKTATKYRELNEVHDQILERLYAREVEERYETWIEELKQKAYISIK